MWGSTGYYLGRGKRISDERFESVRGECTILKRQVPHIIIYTRDVDDVADFQI